MHYVIGFLVLIIILIDEKFFRENRVNRQTREYEKEQNERLGIESWEVRFNKLK